MELDPQACYRALVTHDARFDGAFFVGVKTTGIYCRTVCRAKTPRADRCTFYPTAAAAERAGYRPCLRCRPELAPGHSPVDAVGRLARALMSRIEDGALRDGSVDDLAASLGVSGRHLRRVSLAELGVTPIELAQTHRLLTAKRLLTDTAMTVADVAFASGFSSLSRFNTLFRERYRLSPTDLRRRRGGAPSMIVTEIGYVPPYDWEALLVFDGTRVWDGVERVDGDRYLRTVRVGPCTGWVGVSPVAGRHALGVEMSASLAPAFLAVVAGVKRVCDTAVDPEPIARHLGPLAAGNPGLRVPGAFEPFEIAVRAVLGQQVSIAGATTLAARLLALAGEPIETPHEGLSRLSPTPEAIARLTPEGLAGSLRVPLSRARALHALSAAVAEGRIVLRPGVEVASTIAALKALSGIGEWTAQYIALRGLSWPDAFPASDLGIVKALGGEKEALRVAEAWRPWRAYAAMHIWTPAK